jgi:hypothetical protein
MQCEKVLMQFYEEASRDQKEAQCGIMNLFRLSSKTRKFIFKRLPLSLLPSQDAIIAERKRASGVLLNRPPDG